MAQVVGEKFFNLLEVAIKEDKTVKVGDRLYIGDDKRDHVKYIKSRIGYRELTNFSKGEIKDIVGTLVSQDEKHFADFFNRAGPITTRLHSLELLPGIGKKHLWNILTERRKKPFEDFTDLRKRVEMLPDPKNMVIKRVLEELEGKDRHRIFVASSGY
jgi:putative nucleotide binding protein